MKKLLALLLFAAMLLASVSALATTECEAVYFKWRIAYMNTESNTFAVKPANYNDPWYVMDAEGNKLSDGYAYMSARGSWFEVSTEDGINDSAETDINNKGALDGQGRLIIPMEYADIDYISDNWMMAVMAVDSTSDNYDYYSTNYSTGEKKFYITSSIDVYYKGTKVGTLDRSQCDYAYGYGDYLYVKDRDGKYHYYNKDMVESGYNGSYSSEFDSVYKNGKTTYYHCGSGQAAFTSGCTLTPEEVSQTVMENNGILYDLQGNVIKKTEYYSIYSFENGYAKVCNRAGEYGLIDDQGNEILPCVYENVNLRYEGVNFGYVSIERDGKVGFVNVNTGAEFLSDYPSSAVRFYDPLAFVTDTTGKNRVFSGWGEFEQTFDDFSAGYSYHLPYFTAQTGEGVGAFDLHGCQFIPYNSDLKGTYYLSEYSADGTLLLGETRDGSDNKYVLYHLNFIDEKPGVEAAGKDVSTDMDKVDESAPAAEGWYCPKCGTFYDMEYNFCFKDGTANPLK